jgi:hypothetical protein
LQWLAMSALPPSAAMVSAVRHTILASSGNLSNSCRAGLSHETGRVLRVSAIVAPMFYVVIFDNSQSSAEWIYVVEFRILDKRR